MSDDHVYTNTNLQGVMRIIEIQIWIIITMLQVMMLIMIMQELIVIVIKI